MSDPFARFVQRPPSLGPWSSQDLTSVALQSVVALTLIGSSWWRTAAVADPFHQLPWLALGVAGTILGGAANLRWILSGRRAVGARMGELVIGLAEGRRVRAPAETSTSPGALVAGTGMTSFHRTDCQLVAGKAVRAEARSSHARAGRAPCRVCHP